MTTNRPSPNFSGVPAREIFSPKAASVSAPATSADQSELARLREALRPFAAYLDALEQLGGPSQIRGDEQPVFIAVSSVAGERTITAGDFRRARAATFDLDGVFEYVRLSPELAALIAAAKVCGRAAEFPGTYDVIRAGHNLRVAALAFARSTQETETP